MWFLGIDFGTTMSTAATLRDGELADVEVNGRSRVPSVVLADDDGSLVAGDAAANQMGMAPEAADRTPKESLGGPAPLLLGATSVPVPEAVAAVLRILVEEAGRRHHGPPAATVLTHPARWADRRLAALAEAASIAGITGARLCPEPVAAAVHYARDRVEPGALVAVYDFGGGTFDAAVLRRTDDGFAWVGDAGGDEDLGGEDLDFRLYELVGERLAHDDPDLWANLSESDERQWRRAHHQLMEELRRAKEALSSYPTVRIPVPSSDHDVLVTRDELEQLIAGEITGTVDAFDATLRGAGVAAGDLATIYLAGGSSRIPMVHRLMTERYGAKVATADDPKLVVARGAARWLAAAHERGHLGATATAWATTTSPPAPPPAPAPAVPPPAWSPPASTPPAWSPPASTPAWPPTPEPSPANPPAAPLWEAPPVAPVWGSPPGTPLVAPAAAPPPVAPPAVTPSPVPAAEPPVAPPVGLPPVGDPTPSTVPPTAPGGTEAMILSQALPRLAGQIMLTTTRVLQTGPDGSVHTQVLLADISYTAPSGWGALGVTTRSGQTVRFPVGARQMLRWRNAIAQAMANATWPR